MEKADVGVWGPHARCGLFSGTSVVWERFGGRRCRKGRGVGFASETWSSIAPEERFLTLPCAMVIAFLGHGCWILWSTCWSGLVCRQVGVNESGVSKGMLFMYGMDSFAGSLHTGLM